MIWPYLGGLLETGRAGAAERRLSAQLDLIRRCLTRRCGTPLGFSLHPTVHCGQSVPGSVHEPLSRAATHAMDDSGQVSSCGL